MTLLRFLPIIALLVLPSLSRADEPQRKYVHFNRTHLEASEKAVNFGIVYAGQWISYGLIEQREVIREHGSIDNWSRNMFRPHLDRDSFQFNIFGHSTAGSIYYLFYRTRGYPVKDAFIWSVASSLAFEFTVETLTERPSFQDMYQTPVFGTLVGMMLEKTSLYFHSWDTWPGRVLGYVFNPLSLLPFAEYGFQTVPIIRDGEYGGAISMRF